jgi:hypothetical protein
MPLTALASALLLGTVWVIEVVRVFLPVPALAPVGLACLGVYALLALARASRHIAVLFLVVVGTAMALAAWQGSHEALVSGFAKAQIFGAFLPSILLLRAAAESSPRLGRVREDLGGLEPAAARSWTQYGAHLLGAVLNVGAFAILAPVVSKGADEARRLELARSAARGVGGAVMWSPFFVSLGFVIQLVPAAALWQAMAVGSGLALMGFALSHAIFMPGMRAAAFRSSLARLAPILAPMSLVIGAVVAATLIFRWSGLQAVAIVVPAMCLGYIAIRGPSQGAQILRRTIASATRISDELLIVVGATVLGAAIAALPAVQALGAEMTPARVSGPALLAGLVLVLLALGQLGLHPMIGASVLIPVAAGGDFGVCPGALVSAGVFAWALNASVSIWTLPVAVAASAFGVQATRMVSRRTWTYLLLHAAGGIAYLAAANALLRTLGCH